MIDNNNMLAKQKAMGGNLYKLGGKIKAKKTMKKGGRMTGGGRKMADSRYKSDGGMIQHD